MEPHKADQSVEFQTVDLTESPKDTPSSTTSAILEDHGTPTFAPRRQSWLSRRLSKTNPITITERVTPAPFWSLYKYADKWDYMFTIVGLIGAIANG